MMAAIGKNVWDMQIPTWTLLSNNLEDTWKLQLQAVTVRKMVSYTVQ